MKRIINSIDRFIGIAEKREEGPGEVDKIVGRQVARNLKMVRKIITEEITCCGECTRRADIEPLGEHTGMCTRTGIVVKPDDFCSRGKRR